MEPASTHCGDRKSANGSGEGLAIAQGLPVELLFKIFGYLDEPTSNVLDDTRERLWVPSNFVIPQHTPLGLSGVALVCRNWLEAAEQAMYHTVLLKTPQEYEKFRATVIRHPRLASYVKTTLYECPDEAHGATSSSPNADNKLPKSEDQLEPRQQTHPTLSELSYIKLVGDTSSLFTDTVFSSPSVKMAYLHEKHAGSVSWKCLAALPNSLTQLHLAMETLPQQTEDLDIPYLEYLGLDMISDPSEPVSKRSFRINAPKLKRLYLQGVVYEEVEELLQTYGHQIRQATILSDIADEIFPHLTDVRKILTETFSYCPVEGLPPTIEHLTLVYNGKDWHPQTDKMLDELVQQKDRLSNLRAIPEIAFRHPPAWKQSSLRPTTVNKAINALKYFQKTRELPFDSKLYLNYDGPILSLWSALAELGHGNRHDVAKAPDM